MGKESIEGVLPQTLESPSFSFFDKHKSIAGSEALHIPLERFSVNNFADRVVQSTVANQRLKPDEDKLVEEVKPLHVHEVKPETKAGRIATKILKPFMVFFSGAWKESPQETHPWNVEELDPELRPLLRDDLMVSVSGSSKSPVGKHRGLFWFHLPLLGGWKEYTVLEAENAGNSWHLGWLAEDETGVTFFKMSRLPLTDSHVRSLTGPEGTQIAFFAISEHGEQIPLRAVGQGKIGDGQFGNIRLL